MINRNTMPNLLGPLLCVCLCACLLFTSGCRKKADEQGGAGEKPVVTDGGGAPLVAVRNGNGGAGGMQLGPDADGVKRETLPVPQEPVQPIFDKMVKAYRDAKSYRDNGEINIMWTKGEKSSQRKIKYRTNLQRPNRVQISVDNTVINADGKDFLAYTDLMQGVIIHRKCPEEITLLDLLRDREIYLGLINVETNRFSFLPPPLVLLYAKDPLATFLYGVQRSDISMLSPAMFGDFPCYRISAKRNDEDTVFWIDRDNFLLRRVELPTQRLRKEMATSGTTMDSMKLTMDFFGAEINAQDAQITDTFQVPADAREVENFSPPQLELLGKPVPKFMFTNKDGNAVTPESLKGKTVVLIFWATYGKQFQFMFQEIEKAYQRLKNDPDVVFWAVSVDPAAVADETLTQTLTDFGSTIPYARDPDGKDMKKAFKTQGIITMFLLDKNGTVQAFTPDYSPNLADRMVARVKDVQGGRNVYPEVMSQTQKLQQDYVESVSRWIEAGIFLEDISPVSVPEVNISLPSSPTTFSLRPRWKTEELKGPANILVIPAETVTADDRVFILENGRTITELTAAGEVKNRHELALEPEDFELFLVSAVMPGTGKRVFATYGKRVHLFDENWQPISRYPDVPARNLPNIIADMVLCDLDGDGRLEFYVSFWEGKGVHKVSLEGKLLGQIPELETVFQMAPVWNVTPLLPAILAETALQDAEIHSGAVTGPKPAMLCANRSGNLILVDSALKKIGELPVKGRTMGWIVTADLAGDGEQMLAGMSLGVGGKYTAVGLDAGGKEKWSLDLPAGMYLRPVDMFFPVHVQEPLRKRGQWLVLGVDSSMHLISGDGIFLDQFNFGSVITGVASAVLGGKPVLLISTPEAVQALEVRWNE